MHPATTAYPRGRSASITAVSEGTARSRTPENALSAPRIAPTAESGKAPHREAKCRSGALSRS